MEQETIKQYRELLEKNGKDRPCELDKIRIGEIVRNMGELVDAIGLASFRPNNNPMSQMGEWKSKAWRDVHDFFSKIYFRSATDQHWERDWGCTELIQDFHETECAHSLLQTSYFNNIKDIPASLFHDKDYLAFRAEKYLLSKKGQKEIREIMLKEKRFFNPTLKLFAEMIGEFAKGDSSARVYEEFSEFLTLPGGVIPNKSRKKEVKAIHSPENDTRKASNI